MSKRVITLGSKEVKAMGFYNQYVKSLIEIDPCGQGVPLYLVTEIESIVQSSQEHVCQFESQDLSKAMEDMIEQLVRWLDIIGNPLYFHTDGNQKNLVFNSKSVNEFREDMNDIRTKIRDNYCVLREATM